MSFLRALVCIFCPPLSILDKGCGSISLVFLLTLAGWVPRVIAPIIINYKK